MENTVDERLDIGRTVRRLRKERGITQVAFARLCSIGKGHMIKIESGERIPSFSTLCKLSRGFGMAPHELLKIVEEDAVSDS